MSDWPLRSISECAADEPYSTQIGPFGKALTPDAYRPSGVPLLRGVNVNHGRFHDDDFVFISEEDADRLAKFESFPGDVLLVHKGTLGQIGLMPHQRRYPRYIMGNSMLRVRCHPERLVPEFLYYWFCSPAGQHHLFSRVSQVGVPQIQRPLSTLREARLPVPPLREQRAIAHVLGSLDDKIELNRRMNRTLEQMAAAIFKAWFVDFEPVKAKAAGATRFPGMPQPVFDQLPTTLVDSDLGPIPEGWEVVALSALISLIGGGTPKRKVPEYWGGSIPWFSVRDAPDEHDVWVIDTEEKITEAGIDNSSANIVRPGTTIISARGTVGRLALTAVPMALNQSCYAVQGVTNVGDFFTYFTLRHAVAELQTRAHGSVFDTITRTTVTRWSAFGPATACFGHLRTSWCRSLTSCGRT
ncbi:MAG: restriction endonuclease subunit S [Phycisphaerales bacterium]|nr:restriction endonuclease subunit S [Phycisphaerales bacterium]